MRPFGALYEPHRSQKKCFEQLRSSSVDRSCQMVRMGPIKLKKGQYFFWISGPFCHRVIVDGCFFGVLASAAVLKNQIALSKMNFHQNFDQKHFSVILNNFHEKRKNDIRSKVNKKINCHQNVTKTCLRILFLVHF